MISSHVSDWREAENLDEAKAAAEAAANHLTGPQGPGYGDRDGDGQLRGPSDAGVLPGVNGDPRGFALQAMDAGAPECVAADVLGGSWADPRARWSELESAVAQWTYDNNTFPGLPSHAQRIVGWAELTLATDSLDEAREFGGHAAIHVRISSQALTSCR